ncbi:MAG: hypothetical protein GF308_16775 [Candidatus Heimdallarchaeota archaeon]|nr:hypothetical protein [Candidatus Heimdallarchaeota archaeon]
MSVLMIILAVFLAILAYSMLNIGLALEKKGAAELPEIETESFFQNLKNFLTNKTWLIGFLLTNVQWIFFLLALEYGNLSLVTPMMGVGLVVLVIFSYFYLKEPIVMSEIISIFLIIIGVVVLGVTTSNSETRYTFDEITIQLSSLSSVFFFMIVVILGIGLIIFSVIRKFSLADFTFGLAGGIASGLGAIFTKAFLAGIDFIHFSDSFLIAIKQWEWWLFLFLFVGFNIISMVLPQVGFQKGRAIIVTPLFSVIALLTPCIGGVILFNEWSNSGFWMIFSKIIAIVVIVIGVGILSFRSEKQKIEKELDEDSSIKTTINRE